MTQIRECGRSIGGGTVAFDVEWEGELTGSRIGFAVTITGPDGSEQVRLVHECSPGDDDSSSAFQYVEADGGGRQEVEPDADVRDDHVTVRFRQEVVGVAVDWPVWQAALLIDGAPVAEAVIPTT